MRDNKQYYLFRTQQELDMAESDKDLIVKTLHLNMAARYASLGERADGEIPVEEDRFNN